MISINTEFAIRGAVKSADRPVVASCLLGLSDLGSGLPGISAGWSTPVVSFAVLPCRERNQRPTQAPAAVAAEQATTYAAAATGAGFRKQATHHRTMWAFRGLEPWRDPA